MRSTITHSSIPTPCMEVCPGMRTPNFWVNIPTGSTFKIPRNGNDERTMTLEAQSFCICYEKRIVDPTVASIDVIHNAVSPPGLQLVASLCVLPELLPMAPRDLVHG